MAGFQSVESLLDEWETSVTPKTPDSIERFLNQLPGALPDAVAAAFRDQANRLIQADRQLAWLHSAADADSNTVQYVAGSLRPSDLAAGAEPLPGYTLLSRLGSGGFGEVWHATGPGGFPVALKFVLATGRAGRIEERSLELIRHVRHPHLLAVFGTWRAGDFLVIAMELADGALLDRFREAAAAGHRGIPRDELLGYMAEAARGIDYLNESSVGGKPRIQHRDIKPQNLLLVGGSVKVADFGLARSLRCDATDHTGNLTVAYAAPEFLDGCTSHRSDQYSLAVTYCFLRGGRLPFDGTLVEIIEGHRRQPPDLSMLNDGERPAVAKALAKQPSDRWPSCAAFVEAVIAGWNGTTSGTTDRGDCAAAAGHDGMIHSGIVAAADQPPIERPNQRGPMMPRSIIRSRTLFLISMPLVGLALTSGYYFSSRRPQTRSEARPVSIGDTTRGASGPQAGPTPDVPVVVGNGAATLPSFTTVWEPAVLRHEFGSIFQDLAPGDSVLVGMDVTSAPYGANFRFEGVDCVRPIYREPHGALLTGQWNGFKPLNERRLLAPDGHFVGAIRLYFNHSRIVGLELQFVPAPGRASGSGAESWSECYVRKSDELSILIGDGTPIIGIEGVHAKQELRELRIATRRPSPPLPSPPLPSPPLPSPPLPSPPLPSPPLPDPAAASPSPLPSITSRP